MRVILERAGLRTILLILTILLLTALTENAQAIWTTVASPNSTTLTSVFMVSANDGWAVSYMGGGTGGVILRWNGAAWKTVTQFPYDLASVFMTSANDGWVVGSKGVILHWNGFDWTSVTSPTSNTLNQVYMTSANDGWAVGEGGVILRWNGVDWTSVASPTSSGIKSMFMLDAYEGWAVGSYGWILHWNGFNWGQVASPTGTWLYSVCMVDARDVWAAGGLPGEIQHWNGEQWNTVAVPANTSILDSIYMVSANDGWAVGLHDILHWNGSNWTKVTNPVSSGFNSVFMVNANEGWAVGQIGAIIHWTVKSPVASFNYSPQAQIINKAISFDASGSYDPEGTIESYVWDFGDGANGSGTTVDHVYTTEGKYTVELTVIDDKGQSGIYSQPIEVHSSTSIDPGLWIQVAVVVVAIVSSVAVVVWWQMKKKQKPDFLPPGWQFYTMPTTGEPPGTVFRITRDKKKYWVTKLNVVPNECTESGPKYTQNTSIDILLRFHGLRNIGAIGKTKKIQKLVFEMKDPVTESTSDVDIDPLLYSFLESRKFKFHSDDRYFVIRDATKTKAINYQLESDQVELLKENTKLADKILKQSVDMSSKEKREFVLPQKFDEVMRVIFNAEEIKMKLVDNKIKLSYHPVKGVLEWTE